MRWFANISSCTTLHRTTLNSAVIKSCIANPFLVMKFNNILNSRQVMSLLGICENTLLKYERLDVIKVDFRIGNRKRYYSENILKSFEK